MLADFRAAGRPALSAGSPADARALIASGREALGPGPQVGAVTDIEVPGRSGPIPCRLYRPNGAALGLLVYFHGGGWVIGTLDDFDGLARELCSRAECAVLSVDYRLAPEHPFPAGVEDAEDALRWAAGSAGPFMGASRQLPIAVGGDSAGGNLAAVIAAARDPRTPLALQMLLYPVIDSAMATASYADHGEGLPLLRSDMEWFYGRYAPASQWCDPRISPLRNPSLSGLPPAWIATAEYDVLRDEAEAYAKALATAGVAVKLERYQGMAHGFARMMNFLDTADRMVDDAAAALRVAFTAAPGSATSKGQK